VRKSARTVPGAAEKKYDLQQHAARASVQSASEELANTITHGGATVLAIAGIFVLVIPAVKAGEISKSISLAIYTASLALLYLISTCYHHCSPGRWKRAFRVADHAAIYLLIAGTYTPFMCTFLKGPWGTGIVGTLWIIAAAGTALKIFFVGKFRNLSTLLYVAMGWTALIAARPILLHVPLGCVLLLLGGGVAYTSGVIFYHAIWHLFVTAGSAIHFIAAWRYVLPAR
jgi:hemolysin III